MLSNHVPQIPNAAVLSSLVTTLAAHILSTASTTWRGRPLNGFSGGFQGLNCIADANKGLTHGADCTHYSGVRGAQHRGLNSGDAAEPPQAEAAGPSGPPGEAAGSQGPANWAQVIRPCMLGTQFK